MLQPKRVKFRRVHKMKMKGLAYKGSQLSFGSFGLKSLEESWVTDRQIEGKVCINIFPDKPITKKPAEVRMGKGKGSLDHWVAVVKPGRIIFEIEGVSKQIAEESLRLAAQKLPVLTKVVVRRDYDGN